MDNPYPTGQCTWWAFAQCPWIQPYGNLGNASNWAATARAKGISVSGLPLVGEVMCLQPGIQGASGYGHVGVVVEVIGNSVRVTQMDVPVDNSNMTYGTYQCGEGVSFIGGNLIEQGEDNMDIILLQSDPNQGGNGSIVVGVDGKWSHIGTPQSAINLQGAGIKQAAVDPGTFNAITGLPGQ